MQLLVYSPPSIISKEPNKQQNLTALKNLFWMGENTLYSSIILLYVELLIVFPTWLSQQNPFTMAYFSQKSWSSRKKIKI